MLWRSLRAHFTDEDPRALGGEESSQKTPSEVVGIVD